MQRVKVSRNFYLDEFIDKGIYNRFEAKSQRYIRPELIKIAQLLRSHIGQPMTINNWWTGGAYSESGLRSFKTSTGALYSAHKYGAAMDLKIGVMTSEEMAQLIKDSYEILKPLGVTRIEDPAFTKGKHRDWLHIDTLFTGKKNLQIIKP